MEWAQNMAVYGEMQYISCQIKQWISIKRLKLITDFISCESISIIPVLACEA